MELLGSIILCTQTLRRCVVAIGVGDARYNPAGCGSCGALRLQ